MLLKHEVTANRSHHEYISAQRDTNRRYLLNYMLKTNHILKKALMFGKIHFRFVLMSDVEENVSAQSVHRNDIQNTVHKQEAS